MLYNKRTFCISLVLTFIIIAGVFLTALCYVRMESTMSGKEIELFAFEKTDDSYSVVLAGERIFENKTLSIPDFPDIGVVNSLLSPFVGGMAYLLERCSNSVAYWVYELF